MMEAGIKVMKKIFTLAFAALSVLSVSCQEEMDGDLVGELVEKNFVCHVDGGIDTKTTLDADFNIIWSNKDNITVFAADGVAREFTPVSFEENGKCATFNGSIPVSDVYTAVYPYGVASYDVESDMISASLKTTQPYADKTFADGVNLAVGKTTGENLHFKNVGAILAVKCPTNYASSVKLVSRDPSVKMTGPALIDYNNGNPVAVPGNEADSYVYMDNIGNKYEKTFYFVVYPGNYSQGFDLVFVNSAKTHASVVSSTAGLNLKRNDNILLYDGAFAGWNAPVAPTNLSVQIADYGMALKWTASKSANDLLKSYNIYIKVSGSDAQPELKGSTESTNYTINGLVSGREYDFGVQAVGVSGKKNSEIIWVKNVLYQIPGGPALYPFEEARGAVPMLADMTLCYGGNPNRNPALWDKARWKPHVVYTSKAGKDYWMFDSFLALEFKTNDNGVDYVYDLANTETLSAGKQQWIQQLDYWFASATGFQALDDCIDEAVATAGPYPRKRYVVFSLPDPIYFQKFADKSSSTKYWGDIEGEEMDFSKVEHRQKAYIWMVDQVRERFVEKNYDHIELAGFYILQECLSEKVNSQYKKFKTVISKVAQYCKDCNQGLYWIPYGYSSTDEGHNDAIKSWYEYGFTTTVLQPNKYWDSWRSWDEICNTYIKNNGLGMEFEFEGSHGEGGWSSSETPRVSSSILETVMTNEDAQGTPKGGKNPQATRNKDRFREYMTKCKEHGIYGERMLVLYTGTNAWTELATSTAEKDREFYHETCRFFIENPLKLGGGMDPDEEGSEEENGKLTAPAGVFVEQNDESSVIMSWEDNYSSETGFRVYKCTNGDMSSPATADKEANTTSYQFNWLQAGNRHTFGVQARGKDNASHSDVVYAPEYKVLTWEELQSFNADYYQGTNTFTGTYRECGAPQNPTWKQSGSNGGVLTWNCWSSAETGFNIYVRKSTESAWAKSHIVKTADVNATSAEVTGLQVGQTYTFGVQTKGSTMARNSNIITVGTYTIESSTAVTVSTVTSEYAYIAVDYSVAGISGNPEKGLWISTTSDDPYTSTDGVKIKGPAFKSGSTDIKQLIPASRLNPDIKYYMRAYVWDNTSSKYVYSAVQQIQLGAQPEPISLTWTKQSYSDLPSSVEVYKTTSTMNGRAFNGWYAIADPKEVDFRVMYPETVGTKKTVATQATSVDDCYVLINGAIFGNYNIGVIITEGAMTQQWHGEIEGCYWGTDSELYNITRAVIGVDSNGNPGAYWVGVPYQGKFYYYNSPMTTVAGQAKYDAVSSTFPYPAQSWDPYYAISCGPMLVYDGKVMVDHKKAGDHYLTNYECWDESGVYYGNPDRTAVGVTEDGKIVLFICDGRIDASKGAYLTELARIMKGLGCKYAMNLDGGGSTGMWVKGSGMINYKDSSSWRSVKSTCGFFAK